MKQPIILFACFVTLIGCVFPDLPLDGESETEGSASFEEMAGLLVPLNSFEEEIAGAGGNAGSGGTEDNGMCDGISCPICFGREHCCTGFGDCGCEIVITRSCEPNTLNPPKLPGPPSGTGGSSGTGGTGGNPTPDAGVDAGFPDAGTTIPDAGEVIHEWDTSEDCEIPMPFMCGRTLGGTYPTGSELGALGSEAGAVKNYCNTNTTSSIQIWIDPNPAPSGYYYQYVFCESAKSFAEAYQFCADAWMLHPDNPQFRLYIPQTDQAKTWMYDRISDIPKSTAWLGYQPVSPAGAPPIDDGRDSSDSQCNYANVP